MMARLMPLCVPAALLLLAAPASAAPEGSTDTAKGDAVSCTIRSIHGLQAKGKIDKRLAFLRKQLSKPPFSAYRTMKLLEAKELKLAQAGRKKVPLPTGKVLKLTFKEKLLGRKDDIRLRMHLSITPPKAKRFLPGTLFTIADGGTLLVAGDKYKKGTLVVGITCEAE
jgi:hypothetical protein